MSVVENKLVPVDYDGNGTFDLGFFAGGPSGTTLIGQLAAWLLSPGTGLPSTQDLVDGTFTWALGDLSVPGDGFIPGFGNSLPFAPSAGAFFFAPDFNGDGKTDQGFASEDGFTLFSPPNPPAFYELATWFMDGTGVTFQDFLRDSQGNIATVLVSEGWADPSLYLAIGGRGPLGDFDNDNDTDILFLRPSPLVSGETQIAFWIIENGVVTAQQILGDTAKADWSLVNRLYRK